MGSLYQLKIVESGKELQFLVLISFIGTFLAVRVVALAIRVQWLPAVRDIVLGDVHIHHFVWGVILLLLSGYLALVDPGAHRGLLSILFGAGAALILDEFALLLYLEDVYWTERGRRGLEAVALGSGVFLLLTLHGNLWSGAGQQMVHMAGLLR